MKLAAVMLSAFVLCTGLAVGAEERRAPFKMPPDGKPEALVGGIEYEAPSALAFDSLNRPYMFHTREPKSFGYILTLRDGGWKRLSYFDAVRKAVPNAVRPAKRFLHAQGSLAIDKEDCLYAVLPVSVQEGKRKWVLLYSSDLGETFHVHVMRGCSFLEIATGCNDMSKPPVVGMLSFRKEYPTPWTRYNDLYVFVPEKKGKGLDLKEPVHVTSDCFGVSNHSGGYSFAITTGNKTHLVYAEIPKKPNGGNPTYITTIDRRQRKVLAKRFLAVAPPRKADVHSTPVIAADDKGHLHVVCGAHNNPFHYLRSLKPDDIEGGWTTPKGMHNRQTYATLICDSQNRLHSVYRIQPRLVYQHKPASAGGWSTPVTLVNPPAGHSGYSIFYHRLFIDRTDTLYLSFTFYETRTKEKGKYPRALAVSEDGGNTWKMASSEVFIRHTLAEKNGEQGTARAQQARIVGILPEGR